MEEGFVMNWTVSDIDTYIQQKDYIDTLLVPLLKIETNSSNLKSGTSSAEFLMHLSTFIETQFKGRMMLMPPFSYTPTTNLDMMAETMSNDLINIGFKHIFYITTDSGWTSGPLAENMLWLPAIPIESMDKSLRQSILEDQLKQVIPRLSKKWSSV